jgi:hypothetical protein
MNGYLPNIFTLTEVQYERNVRVCYVCAVSNPIPLDGTDKKPVILNREVHCSDIIIVYDNNIFRVIYCKWVKRSIYPADSEMRQMKNEILGGTDSYGIGYGRLSRLTH